ncbi:MAG: hypothetical protein OK457_11895, partial [Thaumarchaeota archaeon]|nr:hypothetical protein [Nitrososphaerota archaeon]
MPKNSTLSGVIEFFVYGVKRGSDDVPEKVLQIFQAHNARLLSASIYPGNEPKTDFVVDCILDISNIDCQTDDLLILVRKLKFVKRAEKVKMSGRLFSNYQFPLVASGNKRALIVDAESFLAFESTFVNQDPSFGKLVSAKLFELGRVNGTAASTEFSGNDVPLVKRDEYMIEAAKSFLRASGWGVIGSNMEREITTVNVAEPPVILTQQGTFAGGSYLKGLIAGMLEVRAKNGIKLGVTHESYNKDKKILSLYYAKENLAADAAQTKASQSAELQMDEAIEATIAVGEEEDEASSVKPIKISALQNQAPVQSKEQSRKVDSDLGNLDVVRKILTVSKPGALKVTLMNSAKLTLSEARDCIQKLINADLLEVKRVTGTDTIIYQTTPKGIDYLDVHERLSSMLEQDFPDTRVLRNAGNKN